MARLFVLDALGLVYRAHYAFIRRPLVNSRGENTSALFGFATMVLKLRRDERPDHWALAWDGPGPTFRHAQFPDYKATRKPMPDELYAQIPAIEDLAQGLGLPLIEIPGCEADDVMATLAVRGVRDGFDVALVTSDKDLLQLVNNRVRLLSPNARGEDYSWMDRAAVLEKWGVAPEQIRDVLALMGDTSDNVPGVPGVGEKTAVELITKFGTLDALYERLDEVHKKSVREKLRAHRSLAYLSRDLVTVKTDLDLPVQWDDLKLAPIRREALFALADRYELNRLRQIAEQEGVSEGDAGRPVHSRASTRRGSAAETPAEGVRLDGVDSMPVATVSGPAPMEPLVARVAFEPPMPPSPPPGPIEFDFESAAQSMEAQDIEPALAAPAPLPAVAGPASGALERAPLAHAPVAVAEQGALDLFGEQAALAGGEGPVGADALVARLHEVRARALHGLALLPVLEPGPARGATLVGLALGARDGTACYLPIAHATGPNLPMEALREWLSPAFADTGLPKVASHVKVLFHALARARLPLAGFTMDLHLASFVADPMRDHSLDALSRDVLGIELPPIEPEAARGRPRGSVAGRPVAELAAVATRRVAVLWPLAESLRAQLEAREQWSLYSRIEQPLIRVLYEMERAGVRLERRVLDEMAAQAGAEIARLEAELQVMAGEAINLNSGPQLAKLLFETFQLKAGRRTKTGFSTDQATLEELADAHPFPKLLLEYRALSKLKSTYLDALPLAMDPADGRVHTTFHQAGAATGRLASSDPNLQNIPMRTPQGRAIRRAFVAPPGATLIGADYSQIELRVMAHLSGDPQLIEAFQSGEDVHANTARRIFNVTGDLDPALRARAKVVNFGIMYGMGARSLSQQMGITLAEAQEFIAHYFRVYARVREYLDQIVVDARRRGFVETVLGRRRYLPGLQSQNGGDRSLAERVAINTPIQGSAADLMKLAMIRVHRSLQRAHPTARLLLQVHDELLLECTAADAEAVGELVRHEMESCLTLRVPLVVTVGHGASWFDVH